MRKFLNNDIELIKEELDEEELDEEDLDKKERIKDKGFSKKNNIIITNLTKFNEYVKFKRITCLKLNNIRYKDILLAHLLIKNSQKNLFNKL